MNWVTNWVLSDEAARLCDPWTDLGPFGLDRAALVLNRLFVLSLSVLFVWIAVHFLNAGTATACTRAPAASGGDVANRRSARPAAPGARLRALGR